VFPSVWTELQPRKVVFDGFVYADLTMKNSVLTIKHWHLTRKHGEWSMKKNIVLLCLNGTSTKKHGVYSWDCADLTVKHCGF
jgi:hypothetical protein